MSTHYIIRESQFALSDTAPRRKIGINPKGVRVDVALADGGPVRVGFAGGNDVSRQSTIHDLHNVHSFDTSGQQARHLVVATMNGSTARGTVLVWGLAEDPATEDP